MYKIIGSDNLEYGPVSAEVIRQWIAEGRLNAQSRVRPENSADWQPLQNIPEFAADLAPRVGPPPSRPAPISPYSAPYAAGVETNKLAIGGFACSVGGLLLCCCGLLAVPGLIMSIIALVQLNRNPAQAGRGFAIAGIIIALLVLMVSVISAIFMILNPQGLDQIFKNQQF